VRGCELREREGKASSTKNQSSWGRRERRNPTGRPQDAVGGDGSVGKDGSGKSWSPSTSAGADAAAAPVKGVASASNTSGVSACAAAAVAAPVAAPAPAPAAAEAATVPGNGRVCASVCDCSRARAPRAVGAPRLVFPKDDEEEEEEEEEDEEEEEEEE
jgi:hypothetical protein